MTLLSDARQGHRGGLLPWTLLIIGGVASLAADIAVADPTAWSRIIHARPSFALIGAHELLMRQFRANAAGVRNTHAVRTHTEDEKTIGVEERDAPSVAESEKASKPQERRHLHVVQVQESAGEPRCGVPERQSPLLPQVQCDAWKWALANRREDGSLPSGQEIAAQFGRKERWGGWSSSGAAGPPRRRRVEAADT